MTKSRAPDLSLTSGAPATMRPIVVVTACGESPGVASSTYTSGGDSTTIAPTAPSSSTAAPITTSTAQALTTTTTDAATKATEVATTITRAVDSGVMDAGDPLATILAVADTLMCQIPPSEMSATSTVANP